MIKVLLALGWLGTFALAQPIQTGFVVVDGVYNSELIAPYDILEHSKYRDPNHYFRCFVVSPDGKPVTTAEGLVIQSHFSFADSPELDVLVIPSTMTSMDKDLEPGPYMEWVAKKIDEAKVVITLCDGAFPLGKSGRLNGLHATTFPGDRARFASMFPEIQVDMRAWFVQDGKFITSVGGAKSYEPALYLAHRWFGEAYAARLAQGLVIEWDLEKIPHRAYGDFPKKPARDAATENQ